MSQARYVGALDQGTTSTRFMVFDHGGNEISRHQLEHQQILPQPGWVEHDPVEIAARTDEVIARAMRNANVTAADLAAIGVTNQRETTIVWNPKTGRPWYNAIVWQDTRTDRIINALNEGDAQLVHAKKRMQASLAVAKDRLAELQESVTEGARAAAKTTDDYVHENPWAMIGVGAAVGLVAGFLLARR